MGRRRGYICSKTRDYSFRIPRKMRRLALKSALSSKVENSQILVLDELKLEQPKTKEMVKVLKNLKVDGKALLVLPEKDEMVARAWKHSGVKLASVNTLNVLDILNYDKFIITKEAAQKVEEVYA